MAEFQRYRLRDLASGLEDPMRQLVLVENVLQEEDETRKLFRMVVSEKYGDKYWAARHFKRKANPILSSDLYVRNNAWFSTLDEGDPMELIPCHQVTPVKVEYTKYVPIQEAN